MSYRGRAYYGQNYRGRLQYDQNYRSDFRRENFRGAQNYRGNNFRGGYRGSFRNENFGRVEIGLEKDSIQVILEEMRSAVEGPDQVQEWVLIEIGFNVLSV